MIRLSIHLLTASNTNEFKYTNYWIGNLENFPFRVCLICDHKGKEYLKIHFQSMTHDQITY